MTYLNDSGYSAHLEKPSETFNFPEIWVNLTDQIILKVHISSENIPQEHALVSGAPIHFIQFFIAFDHTIDEALFADAARLCALLNKVIPVGALGFSEADRLFTFKYIYPTKELESSALDVIYSCIHHTVELYTPTISNFTGINSL